MHPDGKQEWCCDANSRKESKSLTASFTQPHVKAACAACRNKAGRSLTSQTAIPWGLHASSLVEHWLLVELDKSSEAAPLPRKHTDEHSFACACQEAPDSWSHHACSRLTTLPLRSLPEASSGMFIRVGLFEKGWCHSFELWTPVRNRDFLLWSGLYRLSTW